MVASLRIRRINNCRDMLTKASCPRMRLMWKYNYEKLLTKYWEEEGERILRAAREIH